MTETLIRENEKLKYLLSELQAAYIGVIKAHYFIMNKEYLAKETLEKDGLLKRVQIALQPGTEEK